MGAPFDESETLKQPVAYMILERLGHAEIEKRPIFVAFSGDESRQGPSNLT
jgi:hypothetical protein